MIWFITQYARRKGEWSRRPVFLIARGRSMSPEQADFLRAHGVTRSGAISANRKTLLSLSPAG